MTRRLEEATDAALATRSGRRAVEEAGFSEELKERLLNKITHNGFHEEQAATITAAGLDPRNMMSAIPGAAGEGTRAVATGTAWAGEEAQADAVLRMLHDARKPLPAELRGKPKIPTPTPVDMRLRREPIESPGRRAANARDRASRYTNGLTKEEKEARTREFKDRFESGARSVPATLSGLAELANKRIEDAIARGQFKNIPRGKGVQRDARADNPFIDTTEYIMNNMIKRQDIVPPWIEKQQELVRASNTFRSRLRSDWKRHAARTIASAGGSLQEQMNRALEYARAEECHNPRRRNANETSVPDSAAERPVLVESREQGRASPSATTAVGSTPAAGESDIALSRPFRDATWEAAERSYMELAISNLNTLTRSYNLICPDLAKKPYYSLDRELKACFADVAPLVAGAIKQRAARPSKTLIDPVGRGLDGVLDRFGRESTSAKIYESKAPHYGLKDFLRDLWTRPG